MARALNFSFSVYKVCKEDHCHILAGKCVSAIIKGAPRKQTRRTLLNSNKKNYRVAPSRRLRLNWFPLLRKTSEAEFGKRMKEQLKDTSCVFKYNDSQTCSTLMEVKDEVEEAN